MMKFAILTLFSILTVSSAVELDLAVELRSHLDRNVTLEEFGSIRYRAPLPGNQGPTIVLFHGIYVGSSHQSFREILPLLDQSGARVWIMDLPGCGESDRPKRTYSLAAFDRFIELFLEEVVGEPSAVVSQYVTVQSVLQTAKSRPELFRSLVLMSPTGIKHHIQAPPTEEQQLLNQLLSNEVASRAYYSNLFNDHSLKFLLKKGFYRDERINHLLIAERRQAAENLDQRWITFSFTTGHLYRHFNESSAGVKVPVRMIFGKSAEGITVENKDKDTADLFRAIRPDFNYVEIPDSGHAIHKEQPAATAKSILEFISRPTVAFQQHR
jgi:pimeloyl-ACP methyl ester carboxylesterase